MFQQKISIDDYYKMLMTTEKCHKRTDKEVTDKQNDIAYQQAKLDKIKKAKQQEIINRS